MSHRLVGAGGLSVPVKNMTRFPVHILGVIYFLN
jgi:hypothetical protein